MCVYCRSSSLPGCVFVVQISCLDKHGSAEAIRMRPNLRSKNKVPQNGGSAKSIYIQLTACAPSAFDMYNKYVLSHLSKATLSHCTTNTREAI
jgi:hypothetical protein